MVLADLPSRLYRSRRDDELRLGLRRLSPSRYLYWSHPQGREACRPAGATADQVRSGHQPQDRQGAWARRAAIAARTRRRGDRIAAFFCPVSVASGDKRADQRNPFGFIALVRNFAARFHPAGLKAAKPTRKSIICAWTYHDLTKLDLTPPGRNLTLPVIATAGSQGDRVRLLDRIANGGKRMPDQSLRCEHGDDQNRQRVIHG